jgi:predicted nucleotidyltransferase
MVKSLKDIKKILVRHKASLIKKFALKKIGIFGSYVKGEQKKASDIDILVEFKENPALFEFIDLEDDLRQILKVDVDLVMKDALKPNIGRHILSEVIYI